MKTIFHNRRNFYNGHNIYWYEFLSGYSNVTINSILGQFLLVPGTKYYEFGGNHEEAIKVLTDGGIIDIVEGKEI